jgi:hypothetical protein
MNELERNEFKDRIRALNVEEVVETVRLLSSEVLWNELIRRNTKMLQRINQMEDLLGITIDNIQPISIKAWEDIRHRYDDLETKFIRIRKGFGA